MLKTLLKMTPLLDEFDVNCVLVNCKSQFQTEGGGVKGYSVQKTLQGCATNMGSKISLLVYEWPLIKCKIWYMNGLIFLNWLKFTEILGKKSGAFAQNLVQKWTNW